MSTAEAPVKGDTKSDAVKSDTVKNESEDLAGSIDIITLKLSQLHIDDELNSRNRYDDADLVTLKDSIEATGNIIQPLIVCETKPGTKVSQPFVLVAGFRRAKCLLTLEDEYNKNGMDGSIWTDQVPCMVLKGVDVSGYHSVQLVENMVRADLNPMEICQAIERALEESSVDGKPMTARNLAVKTGLSEGRISQYRKLGTLPTAIQEEVSSGALSFTKARILLEVVPPKHYRRAVDIAKITTAAEFEAKVRSMYGQATVEAAQATDGAAAGGQKVRRTRPAKEVTEIYVPEIKRRLTASTDESQKVRFTAVLDAWKFFMNEEGTQLGKDLTDFERARDEEKARADAEEDQKKGKARLITMSLTVMRQHINKHLEPGDTKPTVAAALDLVKNSIAKDFNAETKSIKVQAGKKVDGGEVEYTDVAISSVEDFIAELHQAWNASVADAKKRTEARAKAAAEKKAAEAAAASQAEKSGNASQEAQAAGTSV